MTWWMWLIGGIFLLFVIGLVVFNIWFNDRTPDNLRGYYVSPIIILTLIIFIALIAGWFLIEWLA